MSSGAARLQHALKTLMENWDVTREMWADGVARDFEKNHLTPLEHQVKTALQGMGEISEVMSKVRRDCS